MTKELQESHMLCICTISTLCNLHFCNVYPVPFDLGYWGVRRVRFCSSKRENRQNYVNFDNYVYCTMSTALQKVGTGYISLPQILQNINRYLLKEDYVRLDWDQISRLAKIRPKMYIIHRFYTRTDSKTGFQILHCKGRH